ncbi:hypothetical protein SEEN0624_07462, partial [Salmonella enterica subsp. enterica serovar Newport str. PRS_2010_0624]
NSWGNEFVYTDVVNMLILKIILKLVGYQEAFP